MDLFDYWEEENEYFDSLPVRYTVRYKGAIYEGDADGVNVFETDNYENAMNLYYHVSLVDEDAVLYDNYYETKFYHGEWDEAV